MPKQINLKYYDNLGERWYNADDDPIAFLRAQSRLFVPWIHSELSSATSLRDIKILDLGCGAGLFSNALAKIGFNVTGIDRSEAALGVARRHDETHTVRYVSMDATDIQFSEGMFDAVLAMDLLEHVKSPSLLVSEVSRVLNRGGRFFFHTLNRNWHSYLIVIKGVEWFVKNTPENLHLLQMFIRPEEMRGYLQKAGLENETLRGVGLVRSWGVFWELLWHGRVRKDLSFQFTSSLALGYAGSARKPG